jgi:hypothetical protein
LTPVSFFSNAPHDLEAVPFVSSEGEERLPIAAVMIMYIVARSLFWSFPGFGSVSLIGRRPNFTQHLVGALEALSPFFVRAISAVTWALDFFGYVECVSLTY